MIQDTLPLIGKEIILWLKTSSKNLAANVRFHKHNRAYVFVNPSSVHQRQEIFLFPDQITYNSQKHCGITNTVCFVKFRKILCCFKIYVALTLFKKVHCENVIYPCYQGWYILFGSYWWTLDLYYEILGILVCMLCHPIRSFEILFHLLFR